MTTPTIVYPVKMEYRWNFSISLNSCPVWHSTIWYLSYYYLHTWFLRRISIYLVLGTLWGQIWWYTKAIQLERNQHWAQLIKKDYWPKLTICLKLCSTQLELVSINYRHLQRIFKVWFDKNVSISTVCHLEWTVIIKILKKGISISESGAS